MQGVVETPDQRDGTACASQCFRRMRRVTTGRNRDDGRSYFAGFSLRHQRIGTRGHLTYSRRAVHFTRRRAFSWSKGRVDQSNKWMISGRELKHPGQITSAECLLEPNKFVRHYRGGNVWCQHEDKMRVLLRTFWAHSQKVFRSPVLL